MSSTRKEQRIYARMASLDHALTTIATMMERATFPTGIRS